MRKRGRLGACRVLALLACLLWLLAAAPPPSAGETFYVRSCGESNPERCSDTNDGRSPERALASIQAGANNARSPGDVVIVGPGVYREGNISAVQSGNAGAPIRILADPTGSRTGDPPAPVVVDAAGLYETGFFLLGTGHVVISGFHVTGALEVGIQVFSHSVWRSDAVVIANNVIFANGGPRLVGRGVQIKDSRDALVFNNLIYQNNSVGISIGPTAPDARLINNTIYQHPIGVVIQGKDSASTASTGAWVINNVIAANTLGIDVELASGCNYIGAFNLVAGTRNYSDTTPADFSDIHNDPRFVAPDQDDFALSALEAGQGLDSLAINAGSAPAALLGLDGATTRTDGVLDTGTVDLGYHAGNDGYPTFETIPILTQTLYVRATGSDANDGRSPEGALASISRAVLLAGAETEVVVGPGVYREGDISPKRQGRIRILADSTGSRTGDPPAPVVVDPGGLFDTGFLLLARGGVVISGFHITGARVAGIQVRLDRVTQCRSDAAVIANNVIFANGKDRIGRGVQIEESRGVVVFNNLIYQNASTGVSIGPSATNARLINNTIYQHRNGVVIRGEDLASASSGAWLLNNIVAANGVGIDVDVVSRCDYLGAFNLVTGFADSRYHKTAPSDPSDLHDDPRFVAPDRADFALSALEAGQSCESVGIDAGSVPAAVLGLDDATTRTDEAVDTDTVDLGFHAGNDGYPVLESAPIPTQTLYVRADGRDASDGLAPENALASISRAIQLARAETRIVAGPGIYQEGDLGPDLLWPAGSISFFADPLGELTGDAPGRVVIDAAGSKNGFSILGRCSTVIDGFNVTGALESGILIKESHGSIVRNNATFSNGLLGVKLANSNDVRVTNNLVYANGDARRLVGGGIQVGGDSGSHRATIENNTIYANGVNGLLIGTGGVPSTSARVRYNITFGNGENGIQLDSNTTGGVSAIGYCAQYNVNADGYGLIWPANCAACLDSTNVTAPCTAAPCRAHGVGSCRVRALGDLTVDPELVSPSGRDTCLGGEGFWDDDFRLKQVAAGESVDSPGVNLSAESAEALGLDGRSTRTDGVPDSDLVDAGYHYPPGSWGEEVRPPGDCDGNGRIGVNDVIRGVNIALGTAAIGACPGIDSNGDGRVTVEELVKVVRAMLCL